MAAGGADVGAAKVSAAWRDMGVSDGAGAVEAPPEQRAETARAGRRVASAKPFDVTDLLRDYFTFAGVRSDHAKARREAGPRVA